jgi:hypothetical protein
MDIQIVKAEVRNNRYKESNKKGRLYFFIERESVLNNLMDRRSRPYNEYRKKISDALQIAGVSKEHAEEVAKKAGWSQTAGCSCGCSPGFIDKTYVLYGKEAFITIK